MTRVSDTGQAASRRRWEDHCSITVDERQRRQGRRPPLQRYRTVFSDNTRWDRFAFRSDDIVISTPPKCGTTWMQMMCAVLIFQDPNLPRPLTELSPWLDMQTDTLAGVRAMLEAQEHRRFIKTHTPLDGIPHDDRVTYISVGRDPRDVALSWDNHSTNMNFEVVLGARVAAVGRDDLAELAPGRRPKLSREPAQRFWDWVDDDAAASELPASLKGTLHHLDTFWSKREHPNIHLFHFADLQADLDAEMRCLATALAIEIDEDRWPALVSSATFESMRARAPELAPQVKIAGFWNDTDRFFHQGTSGQWRSLLGPADLERYEARVRELSSPDLAAWVHTGWRTQAS